MGNMKHPGDAEMFTSPRGQATFATAVVRGVAAYLSAT
jgi:N-acetylmuramoyl-L-alanine amidase